MPALDSGLEGLLLAVGLRALRCRGRRCFDSPKWAKAAFRLGPRRVTPTRARAVPHAAHGATSSYWAQATARYDDAHSGRTRRESGALFRLFVVVGVARSRTRRSVGYRGQVRVGIRRRRGLASGHVTQLLHSSSQRNFRSYGVLSLTGRGLRCSVASAQRDGVSSLLHRRWSLSPIALLRAGAFRYRPHVYARRGHSAEPSVFRRATWTARGRVRLSGSMETRVPHRPRTPVAFLCEASVP